MKATTTLAVVAPVSQRACSHLGVAQHVQLELEVERTQVDVVGQLLTPRVDDGGWVDDLGHSESNRLGETARAPAR